MVLGGGLFWNGGLSALRHDDFPRVGTEEQPANRRNVWTMQNGDEVSAKGREEDD